MFCCLEKSGHAIEEGQSDVVKLMRIYWWIRKRGFSSAWCPAWWVSSLIMATFQSISYISRGFWYQQVFFSGQATRINAFFYSCHCTLWVLAREILFRILHQAEQFLPRLFLGFTVRDIRTHPARVLKEFCGMVHIWSSDSKLRLRQHLYTCGNSFPWPYFL